jgi:hypothetical protein
MLDVSTIRDGVKRYSSQSKTRDKDKGKTRVGVKTVLATVSLGLSAQVGRSRKVMHGKMKNEVRLEATVLLDSILVNAQ